MKLFGYYISRINWERDCINARQSAEFWANAHKYASTRFDAYVQCGQPATFYVPCPENIKDLN